MAQTRQRVPTGVYRPCTGRGGCGGRGWIGRTATGRKIPHARCGGDGWIKTGSKAGGGRRRAGGSLRKARNGVVAGAAVYLGAGAVFGTVGFVLAGVLLGLVALLAVHRVVAGALR